MTEIFVVNSGSSSIKYQLVELETGNALVNGLIERIGEPGSEAEDHGAGMKLALDHLGDGHDIAAVGHRVVHGGTRFTEATVITDQVEQQIDDLSPLAPLHNPANLIGIRAARKALPDIPHVAVFDTAFHRTLAPEAYTYAIDAAVAEKYGVRRYGFHGTSHKYVSERAAEFLGRPLADTKTIVLHLGNGASACAIDGGRSVETSMGMTPLEGLVMGTRSGDLDPAILGYLHRQGGYDFDALDDLLNKRSGLLGLTGSGDMRDVEAAAGGGEGGGAVSGEEADGAAAATGGGTSEDDGAEGVGAAVAEAALAVYRHRIRSYVGAYWAQLGRLDALVFTAGVGENSVSLRETTLVGLEGLGISVDPARNASKSRAARYISPEGSPVAV
ncbi:MAG: acetate kinase, partial [Actinomycetota bacterium]|nr:acetate kinase [Actinomycetota bacterium]